MITNFDVHLKPLNEKLESIYLKLWFLREIEKTERRESEIKRSKKENYGHMKKKRDRKRYMNRKRER